VPLPADRTHRCRGQEVGGLCDFPARRERDGPVWADPAVSVGREPRDAYLHPPRIGARAIDPEGGCGGTAWPSEGLRVDGVRRIVVSEPPATGELASELMNSAGTRVDGPPRSQSRSRSRDQRSGKRAHDGPHAVETFHVTDVPSGRESGLRPTPRRSCGGAAPGRLPEPRSEPTMQDQRRAEIVHRAPSGPEGSPQQPGP
jgi:hypothetical protein